MGGEPHSQRYPTIDHKIPISRGGKYLMNNQVWACRHCNEEKGSRTHKEYLAYLAAKIT